MGSCGRSDVGDEWSEVLHVETMGKLGDCLEDARTGLFNQIKGYGDSENAGLERLLCSAEAPELFNSNRDASDQSVVPEDSCLEATCSTSFGNASQLGDIVSSQSENFAHLNSSIDQKVSLVGSNEPEDVDEIVSVLDKVTNSDEENQSRSLENTKESYLDDEHAQFEGKMGNSTQNGEMTLASPLLFVSTRACTCLGGETVNENLVDPSDETDSGLLGFVEEQRDFSSRTGLTTQMLHLEGTTCNLIGERPTIASECAVEVSTSSQLSQLCGVLDVNSSVHMVPDDPKRDDCNGTPTCIDLLDSTAQPSTIEKESDKPDIDPILTCSDSLRSSHRKSTRRRKSNQMSQTRKNTKQRKTNNKKLFSGQKIGISLKFAQRKRSFQRKQARSSVWGAFGNIMQVFAENESLPKHDTQLVQIDNHLSQRRSGVLGIKKQQNSLAGGSSPVQNTKNCASTSRIRLRVKVGGHAGQRSLEVVLPKEMGCEASLPTIVGDYGLETSGKVSSKISKVTNSVAHKLGENVHAARQVTHLEGDLEMPVGSYLLDSDHGDKSLESAVTLDASLGNSLGDCPGVASQTGVAVLDEAVDNQYSYPGTSPDSEVVNSIQDAGIGAQIHEDLHDVVLSSSHAVLGPIDEAALLTEHMKMKKGKKNGKVKEPLRGGFSVERKTLGRGRRNNSRKLSKCRSGQEVGCVPTPSNAFILERIGNASSKSSGIEIYPTGSFPGSEVVEFGEMLKVETVTESSELSTQDVPAMPSKSSTTSGLCDSGKSVGPKLPKCPKSKVEISKRKSRASDSSRRKRGNACRQKKEGVQKSTNKSEVKENGVLDQQYNGENHLETNSGSLKHPKSRRPAESSGISAFQCNIFNDLGKCNTDSKFACEDTFKPSLITSELDDQLLPPQRAWVRCDECHKWRCISVALANSIEETNCSWTCKDNMDKAFADCSIPQEKTNAEINAELEISDASGEEDASNAYPKSEGFKRKQLTVPRLAPWKSVKSNLFLHRSRKTQTIDEIMVCHCKLPQDGSLGCGDECLNRMLNIECVKGTCPCGELCSNQQFQKRKYAKLKSFPCGKKGHGLQLLQDVSRGAFLIEYVGEVLDLNAYEARQREYAAKGQKHFYFMTLNGSEVIDACAKGNLGRFINHSCDPNCRTEKWMVNGEVCIGLFAIRDIKKGEEVTFDYNYVRVFGAAAKRCVCGSAECQGYIGGDPSNTEAVVQGDSDEEYPEPVMVDEDGDSEDNLDKMISDGVPVQHAEKVLESSGAMIKSPSAIEKSGIYSETEDAVGKSPFALGQAKDSLEKEECIRKSLSAFQPLEVQQTYVLEPLQITSLEENATTKTIPASQPLETSSVANAVSKSLSNAVAVNSKLIHNTEEHKPSISKARPVAKSSRSSSSIKKGKSSSYPVTSSKHQVLTNKPKKMLEGAASNRLDGVEEKLKDLLDSDGGISKRKDATKGYLKLLFLTAASGDNLNGEAVQSTRDLSIILDAFLKTKSKMVLVDIINKNGFQMLHTIMMQNRKNFNRTPIIRKLLKVLEFLAQRDILTLEHINSGPPCAGKESFKESVIQLTRHNDVQVHQIARNFRDRWIPRTNKRSTYTDRDDFRLDLQNSQKCNQLSAPYKRPHNQGVRLTEAIDCISQVMTASTSLDTDLQEATDGCSTNGKKGRKRKSRWDQPSETKQNQNLPDVLEDHWVKQKLETNIQHPEIKEVAQQAAIEVNKEKIYHNCNCRLSQKAEASIDVNAMQCNHEDAPPGFPPPLNSDPVPSNALAAESVNRPVRNIHHGNCACEVFMGHLQERYLSHLPVSYGIPLTFLNRLGTPLAETLDSWKVAPSIPFHPFPPLPRIPRDRSKILPPLPAVTMNVPKEVKLDDQHASAPLPEDRGISGVSGARPPDIAATGARCQHPVEQMRCTSGSLGRRYFRQQKWNNWKYGPQWPGKRNPLGFKTSNSRSGMQSVSLGNVDHKVGTFSCSEGVSDGRQHISSTLYPQPQHQHNH